jgi:hypothetical protein
VFGYNPQLRLFFIVNLLLFVRLYNNHTVFSGKEISFNKRFEYRHIFANITLIRIE